MSAAYDAEPWHDLFVASAGASAALAGLVFVAVSINVERILAYAGLPERALAAVLLLLSVVIVSLFALVPGQSAVALGLELLVLAVTVALVLGWLLRPHGDDTRGFMVRREVSMLIGLVPVAIGAASLLAGTGGGLYWVAAGLLVAITVGVTNGWVLLVEILR